MSEAQENMEFEETSAEDKFFGVKNTIGKKQDDQEETESSAEFEVELIDDRPEEDRRPPKVEPESEESEEDEELSGYSEKVQKRITKLKYEQHEERRRREEAEKMREEAVLYAQNVLTQNKEYESLINKGEAALVGQIKQKAQLALEAAKTSYKRAYEEGNTDGIVSAQETLNRAQSEFMEAEKYENNLARQQETMAQQPQQQPQQQYVPQQQPQQPQRVIQPEAKAWSEQNPWFMQPGYEKMTSLALGIHEELKKPESGVIVNSQEYYNIVDAELRQRFPEHDWPGKSDTDGRNAPVTVNQPSTVVAPQVRNNGAKPRKVQLAPSQRALAKRLGLTNEQYAAQLLKEGRT